MNQKYSLGSAAHSAYGGASSAYGKQALDVTSNYSYTKSHKANQTEIIIDIHVKHLKLKVSEKTALRVVWSRGKKQAKTQAKVLNAQLDKAVFDEKFQINTVLELDPETGMPAKEKLSKLTVQLDKSMGGHDIGEIDFNMADFKFAEYKVVRLNLVKCDSNNLLNFDPKETYLDVGLKGTKAQGLLKRSAAKSNYGGSASGYHTSKTLGASGSTSNLAEMGDSRMTAEQNATKLMQDNEKLKKESRQQKRDYDREMVQKNTKINNLLTDIENNKTDVEYYKNQYAKVQKEREELKTALNEQQSKTSTQIKELQQELDTSNKALRKLQSESSRLETMYNFERFNTNFTGDVAVFKLKGSKRKKFQGPTQIQQIKIIPQTQPQEIIKQSSEVNEQS